MKRFTPSVQRLISNFGLNTEKAEKANILENGKLG